MSVRNRNQLWGRTIADELARHGIRHVVVSPGSRSTPLVLAVAEEPRLEVHAQLDERSAGYFAVGVGKATDRPAAILTTSGTAVANLLPAVVEAAMSETPLLLLTADRPPRLRGADANQTIQQVGIFGEYVRRFDELPTGDASEAALRHVRSVVARALASALGEPAGPAHLNVPFAKPLEPTLSEGDISPEGADEVSPGVGGRPGSVPWTAVERLRAAPSAEAVGGMARALKGAERPLLVAGVLSRPGEAGPAILRAARSLGIPVLADPLSGARYAGVGAIGSGPETPVVVGAYDLLLQEPSEELMPDLVLRVGAAPTSAALDAWLSGLEGTALWLVDGGGRWKDHSGGATRLVRADPALFLDALVTKCGDGGGGSASDARKAWAGRWRAIESAVRAWVRERTGSPAFEGAVVADAVRRISVEDPLFISNSMPVRDLDTFVPTRDRPLTVLGNRGASGIDGIVSTAAGVAAGTGRRVVAILGDLALLHDSNGLAFLREEGVRVLLVVINNDGGGIFHLLPVREIEPPFTALFATPHGRNLARMAELHDLPHVVLDLRGKGESRGPATGPVGEGAEALDAAWAAVADWEGSGILEIRTDREENRLNRGRAVAEIVRAVATALDEVNERERGSNRETE